MRTILPAIAALWSLAPAMRQEQDYAKLLKEAKITLVQAIELAVKDSEMERFPLDAWIEEQRGKREFYVNGSRGDRIFGVSLDLTEGKVLMTFMGRDDRSAIAKAFKIKLTDAVQAALKQEKGQAVRATFALTEAKKPEATVKVFHNGKLRIVTLDGETGKIIAAKDGP